VCGVGWAGHRRSIWSLSRSAPSRVWDGINHDDRCVSCVARALRFTTAETAALMMLGLRIEPDGQGGWLDPAVAHRAEIHQAAGMVSVQLDLSTAQALARMRAHAFVHNRLLIQVALDVVARRLVFTQDME